MCDDDLTDGGESADPEMLQMCDDGLMEVTVQILKCYRFCMMIGNESIHLQNLKCYILRLLMGDKRFCLQYLKCNRFCV